MQIKNLYISILSVFIYSNITFSQPNANTWTWQSGNNMPDQVGHYGPSVLSPGYRGESARWVYNNKTYVFGGYGYNDLWEYDPATNNWTWIKGPNMPETLPVYGIKNITTATNNPGERYASTTWIFNNKFYMFGGYGGDKTGDLGFLNDIWQYDPATNNWTWIGGSDTKNQSGVYNSALGDIFPGGRNSAASAIVGTKLIVFGGYGMDQNGDVGALNDLWEYDIVFNEWTHKAGAVTINDPGEYVGNQTDFPAARYGPSFWDNNGVLYVRGGTYFDGTDYQNMSDFWKYEYNTNQFTLISGSNNYNVPPVFGQLGVPNYTNTPGSIFNGECYSNGIYLYYFGGINGTTYGNYNALWQYNTVSNIWTWIKGSNMEGAIPEYGTLGVENVNNSPAPYNEGGRSLTWVFDNKLYIYEYRDGKIHLCAFNLATQNWVTLKELDRDPLFGNIGLNNNNIQKPGARYEPATWEYNGKMYVFGGKGNSVILDSYGDLYLNDIWQYDPITKVWEWQGGSHLGRQIGEYGTQNIPSITNHPGGRENSNSCRIGNKVYLFGGYGLSETIYSGYLADLWEYNLDTKIWTWLKGSKAINSGGIYGIKGQSNVANMPGARYNGSMVAINNKIYLFGGYGYNSAGTETFLNDTWEYDPATNNWKWLKGEDLGSSTGNFGTINLPNITNEIPSCFDQSTWVANNKMYVFGGHYFMESGSVKNNCLWEYNPNTNIWTWLKGNNDFIEHAGVYGSIGVASPSNMPGTRYGSYSFTHEGKLFLFAGFGPGLSLANEGHLSDLWEYNLSTNNWRWIKGPISVYPAGVLGTQGVPNISNNPAGHQNGGTAYFNNKFTLFGGYSYDIGESADLWEYIPTITCTNMSTVASGNWNNTSTWSCGRLPLATDIITINAHTIDLTANGFAKNVIYNANGTLRLGVAGNLVLNP